MPTTTIPITLHVSVVLPEGVTLAPPPGGELNAWRFASASEDAYQPAPQPEVKVEDDQLAAFLRAQLQTDLDRHSAAAAADAARLQQTEALVRRLRAENNRLECEASQLREELTWLHARNVEFNLRSPYETMAESAENSAAAASEADQADATEDPAARDRAAAIDKFLATAARPKPKPIPNYPDDTSDPDVTAGFLDSLLDSYPVTARQQFAITHLMVGETVTETARDLGVARSTVTRWLRKPHVRAYFKQQLQDMKHSVHAKLESLCDESADVVIAQVRKGNFRAALQVLKGKGYLTGQPWQPTRLSAKQPTAAASAAPPTRRSTSQPPPFPQRGSLNGHKQTVGSRP